MDRFLIKKSKFEADAVKHFTPFCLLQPIHSQFVRDRCNLFSEITVREEFYDSEEEDEYDVFGDEELRRLEEDPLDFGTIEYEVETGAKIKCDCSDQILNPPHQFTPTRRFMGDAQLIYSICPPHVSEYLAKRMYPIRDCQLILEHVKNTDHSMDEFFFPFDLIKVILSEFIREQYVRDGQLGILSLVCKRWRQAVISLFGYPTTNETKNAIMECMWNAFTPPCKCNAYFGLNIKLFFRYCRDLPDIPCHYRQKKALMALLHGRNIDLISDVLEVVPKSILLSCVNVMCEMWSSWGTQIHQTIWKPIFNSSYWKDGYNRGGYFLWIFESLLPKSTKLRSVVLELLRRPKPEKEDGIDHFLFDLNHCCQSFKSGPEFFPSTFTFSPQIQEFIDCLQEYHILKKDEK